MSTNLAFISTAHIHTKGFIEETLRATDGRRVTAVWDDVQERGKNYAALARARFVPDLDALLADAEVDGFVICAENTKHLPLLKKVLPVGKPVFCEKPLVTNSGDLREIRALHAKYPAPLFCGYMQPFSADMTGVAALLSDSALGKVTRIRFTNAHHAAYGRWFDSPDLQWFAQPELSGGGAFMDMGTHAVHLVRTLFGPVTKVRASLGNHSGNYPAVDDWGIAELQFANGIVGTLTAAWTQTGGYNGLEIQAEKGAVWNTDRGYVTGAPGQSPLPLTKGTPLPDRMDRLVAIIRGEIPPLALSADLDAIMDSVAIMDAAYRSAKSGVWEPVTG